MDDEKKKREQQETLLRIRDAIVLKQNVNQ